ncbi:DNA repair protein RecN [Striga asiatica]|uniref:DNA repair protein RecN n=1 Tax=Striga asiatica TaxID=4170 RepID=A0A5A7PD11_STRAF|nr:DNA repair protein RecN [Striga asiatica]
MLSREINHLLRLLNPSNHAPANHLPMRGQRKHGQLERPLGQPHHNQLPIRLQQVKQRLYGMKRRHRIQNPIQRPNRRLQLIRQQKLVRAKSLQRIGPLLGRDVNHSHFCPKRLEELHCHVAKPAEPGNPDIKARLVQPVVSQRAVRRDTRADERGTTVHREILRPTDDKVLFGDHEIGIAAVSEGPVRLDAVVGVELLGAEVLEAGGAVVAVAARADHDPDGDLVPGLEFGDAGPDFGDEAHDLMARDHGVVGEAPVVLDEVEVRVADSAEHDFELDVLVASGSTGEVERGEDARGVFGAPPDGVHGLPKMYEIWIRFDKHASLRWKLVKLMVNGAREETNNQDHDVHRLCCSRDVSHKQPVEAALLDIRTWLEDGYRLGWKQAQICTRDKNLLQLLLRK